MDYTRIYIIVLIKNCCSPVGLEPVSEPGALTLSRAALLIEFQLLRLIYLFS